MSASDKRKMRNKIEAFLSETSIREGFLSLNDETKRAIRFNSQLLCEVEFALIHLHSEHPPLTEEAITSSLFFAYIAQLGVLCAEATPSQARLFKAQLTILANAIPGSVGLTPSDMPIGFQESSL